MAQMAQPLSDREEQLNELVTLLRRDKQLAQSNEELSQGELLRVRAALAGAHKEMDSLKLSIQRTPFTTLSQNCFYFFSHPLFLHL